eukprot:459591_1
MRAFLLFLLLNSLCNIGSSSIIGLWHINDKGYPLQSATTLQRSTLIISQKQSSNECDGLSAMFLDETMKEHQISITQCFISQSFFINNTIIFNFCIDNKHCFDGKIIKGIMTGHQCISSTNKQNCSDNNPSTITPFSGWNQLDFDGQYSLRFQYNVPRDYLLNIKPLNKDINNGLTSLCHLRIDYNETNKKYIGRYKIFYQLHSNEKDHGEQLEYDLNIISYNGSHLQFILYPNPTDLSITQTFTMNIKSVTLSNGTQLLSRNITGTYNDSRYKSLSSTFNGVRWNIFSFGLINEMNSTKFQLWQNRTRTQLKFLMMFGNPMYKSVNENVTKVNVSETAYGWQRDDNYKQHAQNYNIYNITLDFQIPNYYKPNKLLSRKVHGYVSIPFNSKNGNKLPFVVGVNGHSGSSWQLMYPPDQNIYWYGDAFARRNYIVFAIDISHRNSTPLYSNFKQGDDPEHDNHAHPAIIVNGYNFSDFEEDGERVWDAYHSAKWLMSTDTKNIFDINVADIIDKNRVYVSGLSMGGEITTFVGGLFANDIFCGVIPAGFSPDLDVMWYHGNHPCWRWTNANIREHMDTATLHGLIVPNLLVVLTGQGDSTYSNHNPPYSGDKQVLRRSRSYMSNNNVYKPFNLNVFHYLHYDVHRWHAGDIDDDQMNDTHLYVQIPNNIEPTHQNMYNDMVWQNVANTSSVECPNNSSYFNVFELLQYYSSNK